MKYRADEGIANGSYSSPEVAADAVIRALQDDPPATRYPVGDDAKFMLELASTRVDHEIDAFILDMYRSAPV